MCRVRLCVMIRGMNVTKTCAKISECRVVHVSTRRGLAHGGYAPVGNYPPPPRAHGGYHSLNPFSVANLPQQPFVQEEVAGPSHEQPHPPSSGPSPAHRNSVPRHDCMYNQF